MNSKGDVVDERLLIRYMYIHVFYGASALFCTPRRLRDDADVGRRRANDRFAIFWGEVLRKMAKRDATESSAAPRRRPKRHTWQWNGSPYTKRLSTVSSLYVVHAHTQYAYNNICTHLFCIEHPTPNTQKKKGEKRKGKHVLHSIYQPCARARTKPGFAHARVCAHTGSTRRRVRFLRRVVARGDMGRFAYSRAVVVVVVELRSTIIIGAAGRRGRTRLEASIGTASSRGRSRFVLFVVVVVVVVVVVGANDGNSSVRTASYPFRATSVFV